MDNQNELSKLQDISQSSLYAAGIMPQAIQYCFNILSRYYRNGKILELGPAEGVMTEHLAKITTDLTVVEGAKHFCDELSVKYPNAKVFNSLFENFQTDEKYDLIVLGHVLEHVEDPVLILKNAKEWLSPGGIIFAAVPNSRSLHRQAAVMLGLLDQEDSLNELDIHHGHRRVFSPETFRGCFYQAQVNIEIFGGYWLKPLSNRQLEASWDKELVETYFRLGERYPDIAGEMYIVGN